MGCNYDIDCDFGLYQKCCFGTCVTSSVCDDVRGLSIGIIIAIAVGSFLSLAACIACCVCCCCRNSQNRAPQAYTTTAVTTTVPRQQFVQAPPTHFQGQQPLGGYPPQQQPYSPQPIMQQPLQNVNPGFSGQMAYPPQSPQGQIFSQPATNPDYKPLLDTSTASFPAGPPPPYQ